jgi:signal transduction histidine kinase/CheY-like chemotaxis protein
VIDSGIAWILAPLIVASVALLGLSIFRLWRHGQQTDHLRRAERARHRVREQVWRMKNSRDIETVVYAVGEVLYEHQVRFDYFGVNVIADEASSRVFVYAMDRHKQWQSHSELISPNTISIWRNGEIDYRRDIHRDDPWGERKYLGSLVDEPFVPRAVLDAPFSLGSIAVSSHVPEAFSDEDVNLLAELANVLTEGFHRLQDLETLEARRDELEREAGERRLVQRDLESAKEQAESANRAKSLFLANMSHEIRTPLNALLGYAQILGDHELAPDQRHAVRTIRESGEHLLTLINAVLDLSKIEAGSRQLREEDFDLGSLLRVVDAVFSERSQARGLAWVLRADLETRIVYGDQGKLRQILFNLLGNAVKCTDQGAVTLTVDGLIQHAYCFTISDTGPGIDAEEQATIFEPFRQGEAGRRHGGTGLGLAIARSFAELMQGDLRLRPSPDGGTTFQLELPLPPGTATVDLDDDHWGMASHLAPGEQVYALVVDDIRDNLDVLVQFLERVGVEVDTAQSGQQALDRAAERCPDIVFLDLNMPGMGGIETRSRLVADHGERIRTVAVTASVLRHQREETMAHGFDAFLDKPVRRAELYRILAEGAGTQFVFREDRRAISDQPSRNLDWLSVQPPPELLEQLLKAARFHSVTDVRGLLEELRALGAAEKALARHLEDLCMSFDMIKIQSTLESIAARRA